MKIRLAGILLLTILVVCPSSVWGQGDSLSVGQYLRVKIAEDFTSEEARIGDPVTATLIAPVQKGTMFTARDKLYLKPGKVYRALTEVKANIDIPTSQGVAEGTIRLDQGVQFTSADVGNMKVRLYQIRNRKASEVKLEIKEGNLNEMNRLIPENSTLFGTVVEVRKSVEGKTPGLVNVVFDSLNPPSGLSLRINAMLMELLPANDPRLDNNDKFLSDAWMKDHWVFLGSKEGAILSRIPSAQESTLGDYEAEVEDGTEVGLVLTQPVKMRR